MTFTVAEAATIGLLGRGSHFVTNDDGVTVGVITVSRNQERLHADRLADRASVRTDYTASQLESLAEWLQSPNNWRADQQ